MADAKQMARQSIDAFNQGKLEEWGKTVAEDAELVTPMAGTIKGRDAIKGYFEQMRLTFPDAHVDVHKVIGEGNTVVTEYTFTGTHKGPMRTPTGEIIPPTNKTLSGPALDIGVMDDKGQLKSLHQYFDTARGLQQLGLMPAPAAAPRT
ncbi:MAG TPA: ester cyclase [Candidatus Dormibacteraeota bacterium]|nr:ester cyclase [Candidatus Dormibacteraeota bacterium]